MSCYLISDETSQGMIVRNNRISWDYLVSEKHRKKNWARSVDVQENAVEQEERGII